LEPFRGLVSPNMDKFSKTDVQLGFEGPRMEQMLQGLGFAVQSLGTDHSPGNGWVRQNGESSSMVQ
jgi:hypothetical protein